MRVVLCLQPRCMHNKTDTQTPESGREKSTKDATKRVAGCTPCKPLF